MSPLPRALVVLAGAVAVLAAATACGGSESSNTTSAADTSAAAAPQLDAGAFTADFSQMAQLKGLAGQGKGLIGVLLPDTTTSARYVTYDAPYLKKAFEAAGFEVGPVQDR